MILFQNVLVDITQYGNRTQSDNDKPSAAIVLSGYQYHSVVRNSSQV